MTIVVHPGDSLTPPQRLVYVLVLGAASLLGAVNFGLAGLTSPIVGLFGITNAIPMGAVMGVAAVLSIVLLCTVVRPRTVPALSR